MFLRFTLIFLNYVVPFSQKSCRATLCVTVGDKENMKCDSLLKLSPDHKVHYLQDLKFQEFFTWLSRSIQKSAMSMTGEEVYYDPTTTWGEILGQS